MVVLFILDLLCQKYYIYATTFLLIYVVVSMVMALYVLYHVCCVAVDRKSKRAPKSVDWLEIMESAFVLMGSLTAIVLYAESKIEAESLESIMNEEFGAFCELTALSVFMVSQYATICYIQFHIDRIQRGPQVLVLSGAMSAVSIMYMFLFEYHHLISLLSSEGDHDFTDKLKVAYSLFWCPIEYFVWSFVTVNHMLHHWRHLEHGHGPRLKQSQTLGTHSMPGHSTLFNGKVSGVAEVIDLNASRKVSIEVSQHSVSRRRNSSMLFVQPTEEQMQLNPMAMAFSPTASSVLAVQPLESPRTDEEPDAML